MKELNKNWLTDGLIDFEYKKYLLLAYFKEVKKNFNESRLYPFLSDLIFHYQNLLTIKEHKKLIYDNFPQVITKADFEKLKISYEKIIQDDNVMQEIEDILSFSIPQFKTLLDEGKDLYDFVEKHVEIMPIGISPLYAFEGYLLINQNHVREMDVYRYQITVFENANEKFRGVHTEYIESEAKGIGRTFEQMKLDLIKRYKEMPNPATYMILTHVKFPYQHTLLPIAKRLLVKYINTSS
ncbi:hypothetical protein BH23BAC1_BH23BAC1_48430 [soil metagenome]